MTTPFRKRALLHVGHARPELLSNGVKKGFVLFQKLDRLLSAILEIEKSLLLQDVAVHINLRLVPSPNKQELPCSPSPSQQELSPKVQS